MQSEPYPIESACWTLKRLSPLPNTRLNPLILSDYKIKLSTSEISPIQLVLTTEINMGSMTNIDKSKGYFVNAQSCPPDAIFELTARYLDDKHPKKVNLGQGAYRDEDGKPWILPSVQKAKAAMHQEDVNHEYLPILGHTTFRDSAARVCLGQDLYTEKNIQVC